jgi:hypothetical protein
MVGVGGAGKTSVLEAFLTQIPDKTGASGVFVWSFYEDARTENLLREALGYFAQEPESAEGARLRARVGDEAYRLNVNQFCCAGLNFGYFYDRSPIIVGDGEQPPPYTMGSFTASTVAGCRAPHFWLADGRSLYDAFGPAYTLLRFDRRVDIGGLVDAAAAKDVPLAVLDVEAVEVPDAYRHPLVLCRTDQHIAWRGDRVPMPTADFIDTLRGASA